MPRVSLNQWPLPSHAEALVVGGYFMESPFGKIKGDTGYYLGFAYIKSPSNPERCYTRYSAKVDVILTNQTTGETSLLPSRPNSELRAKLLLIINFCRSGGRYQPAYGTS